MPIAPPSQVTATRAPDPMPVWDSTLNLDQRMLAVMHAIGYIPKSGTGPESQGSYAFARVEVIKDAVRDACIAHGVMVHVSMDGRDIQLLSGTTRDGYARTSVLATVWGSMTFVNVDSPDDERSVTIHGQGIDSQDKAVSKATTSAVKYGLLNAFAIPTGDDPDETGQDLPVTGGGVHQGTRSSAPAQRPSQPAQPAYDADGVPFPDAPNGHPAASRPASGGGGVDADRCPKHDRAWRAGSRGGWYCSAQDQSTESGYCTLRPSRQWMASHER